MKIHQILVKKTFSLIEVLLVVILLTLLIEIYADQKIEEATRTHKVPDAQIATEHITNSKIYNENYSFTSDWFSNHIPVWHSALSEFKGKPNIQYLEVGVFEGRASMWMLENILTHPSARMTGMDLFAGVYNNHYPDFAKRFFDNLELSGEKNKVETIAGYSQVELRKAPLDFYDIIYIDGSHENRDVLEDAILSMRLLKEGGVLIFDDYAKDNMNFGAPKLGIDAFYRFYGESFTVLHNGHQVVLKKRTLSK